MTKVKELVDSQNRNDYTFPLASNEQRDDELFVWLNKPELPRFLDSVNFTRKIDRLYKTVLNNGLACHILLPHIKDPQEPYRHPEPQCALGDLPAPKEPNESKPPKEPKEPRLPRGWD